MKIKVLYEDSNILAIDKPSGISAHGDGKTKEKTIADWVLKNYPKIKNYRRIFVWAHDTNHSNLHEEVFYYKYTISLEDMRLLKSSLLSTSTLLVKSYFFRMNCNFALRTKFIYFGL